MTPSLLPGCDSPAARVFIDRLSQIPRLAHHPTCRCYDNHLLRIGRFSICLGCACMTSGGMAAALALLVISCWRYPMLKEIGIWKLIGLGVLLYLPSLGQLFIQSKPYKIASRTALGMAVVILWFGAIVLLPVSLSGFALRGTFIVTFVGVWKATLWARSRHVNNPCIGCSLGVFPLCRDHLIRSKSLLNDLQRDSRAEDAPFIDFIIKLRDGAKTADFEICTPSQIIGESSISRASETVGI